MHEAKNTKGMRIKMILFISRLGYKFESFSWGNFEAFLAYIRVPNRSGLVIHSVAVGRFNVFFQLLQVRKYRT